MFNGQPLGKDSSKWSPAVDSCARRQKKIFPNMSVLENLELGSFLRASERMHQNLEHVFDVFPRLRERMDQNAGTLSGGEQQMLAIGRGLMAEPLFLILDEPSLGLSPLLVEEMFNLIKRLNDEGMTIMLVEQNVIQSLELASRAYIIENGEVAISGDAQTVMNDPELQRTYLGL